MCVFVCVFTILNPLNYYRMSSINTHMYKNPTINQHKYQREVARDTLQITSSTGEGGET